MICYGHRNNLALVRDSMSPQSDSLRMKSWLDILSETKLFSNRAYPCNDAQINTSFLKNCQKTHRITRLMQKQLKQLIATINFMRDNKIVFARYLSVGDSSVIPFVLYLVGILLVIKCFMYRKGMRFHIVLYFSNKS